MLTETLHNEVWFNIPAFPEATFTSTGIVKNGETYDVSGDLTIRGITKPVKFPATITIEGDTLKTQAKFELPRADWGMTDTGIGDGLIKENAEINFDVTAKKA
jgi:polyisoprenoid-binding protein YceI